MARVNALFTVVTLLILPASAMSHEFWIEPEAFQLPSDGRVVAHLKNGELFKGASLSYLTQRARRHDFMHDGVVTPIPARMGDRPAIDMAAPGGGMIVLVHETADSTITYREMEKFAAFATHKDAPEALAEQLADGIPEAGLVEVYSRYAKSLVAFGEADGTDKPQGMVTEIVALENPYTDVTEDGVDVVLLYADAPRSDAQIEVFERAPDASVNVRTVRTDDRGRATVAVRPGHAYMLDAVVLRPASAELAAEHGATWESLWANLTFFVPE